MGAKPAARQPCGVREELTCQRKFVERWYRERLQGLTVRGCALSGISLAVRVVGGRMERYTVPVWPSYWAARPGRAGRAGGRGRAPGGVLIAAVPVR